MGLCGCQDSADDDTNDPNGNDDTNPIDPLSNFGWSNSEYGLGLDPPDGWTVEDPDSAGKLVRFHGPTINQFAINISLAFPTSLGSSGTLNGTFKQMITLYENVFNNFLLISEQERIVNDMNAYEIVYNYTSAGINIKQKQVGVEKDESMYLFTFSATDSTYDEYVTEFENSLITFTVI